MVILQINVVCGQGSTGRIAVDIAKMLNNHGDIAYIAFGYGETDYPESYKISSKWESRINAHFYSRLGLQGRGIKYGTRKFLKWVDKIHPDIIHLHNIHGSYIHYPLLFNYIVKNNIPVVWTIHDCWPVTAHCAHFVPVNCDKWETMCHHCTVKGIYKEEALFDNSKSAFRLKNKLFTSVENMRLIPVSKWMNTVISKSFLSRYPSSVIYNGVDLSVFRYVESDIKERYGVSGCYLILGVASQWSDVKGFGDFIRLADFLPDNYVLFLVGLSNRQLHNLSNKIKGIERTNNQLELVELYSAADVTLSLSYAESMGLTIVESMACGTPVVTYDNTAQPELVTEETGAVVKTGQVKSVADRILSLTSKGRASYSDACRKRVESLFDKRDRCLDYYEEYRKLLIKR